MDGLLFEAIFEGDISGVRQIIAEEPQSIHVHDESLNDSTPLHVAIGENQAEIARVLIGAGASVCAEDGNGAHPLHLLAQSAKCAELLPLLLDHGADVNHRDRGGRTPLMNAAESACLPAIPVLLAIPTIRINEADKLGDTALHIAALAPHPNLNAIALLRDAGASDVLENGDGLTVNGIIADWSNDPALFDADSEYALVSADSPHSSTLTIGECVEVRLEVMKDIDDSDCESEEEGEEEEEEVRLVDCRLEVVQMVEFSQPVGGEEGEGEEGEGEEGEGEEGEGEAGGEPEAEEVVVRILGKVLSNHADVRDELQPGFTFWFEPQHIQKVLEQTNFSAK